MIELKPNMRVTFRSGEQRLITSIEDDRIWLDDGQYLAYCDPTDLTNEVNPALDIVKVEVITVTGFKTVWSNQRKYVIYHDQLVNAGLNPDDFEELSPQEED